MTRKLQSRPAIRRLTERELASLEQALGKPVDRRFLTHWMSQSIVDAVTLASRPSPRILRDLLLRIEGRGREWLSEVEDGRAAFFLATYLNVPKLSATTTEFF